MELQFELVRNLTTEVSQNVPPLFVSQLKILPEPDGRIFQYYTQERLVYDKQSHVQDDNYSSLSWKHVLQHLTTHPVERFGIKGFPGIGALGFYKESLTGLSYVMAPVHAPPSRADAAPQLQITPTGTQMQVQITPPENLQYTAYRIICRMGNFAYERITYQNNCILPLPKVNGTYEVTAIGYESEEGKISDESNVVSLVVTNGKDSWNP